ncbi:MAG: hypothetical protein A3G49_05825 [Candidatus Sungbacteria bacterium RIFCSPLOWO2_12_FULL_41_11]|uniref:Uncharacterized protein n=1 Tax=Candidatus Sungbacteria bacterium RIFCSPLOWO2_12_FULL_41_11 TaxID=1802286 RepID=A0A1G2LPT9_9BACT|nr:MAG: hypothetical protein A3D41_01020 [Candidatus Sungbacteria bacterium RIFCSPHIGHO2_02_FULL_41_12b]OHA13625.1 MAG: hypothetical protein A3G49_05825 [Candidatus Sungbacteria bacterium RIFCSPLOWO2_12_FULL_41_11]
MNKNFSLAITGGVVVVVVLYIYFAPSGKVFDFSRQVHQDERKLNSISQAVVEKFNYLSQNGNSACSASFRNSIFSMPDSERIRGSCCSPMSLHRYSEQVEGLHKFKSVARQNIAEIPDDPYDVDAGLAKKLLSYYDLELTIEEQKAYDYAMQNSSEKGPCCCKCWRWFVYGGLAKFLIRHYNFSGEQITEVWNLSDGCGGEEGH